MFYTSELNLKGKGPLGRLWQACHQPNKINKKALEEFDYQTSYEAIVQPSQDRTWALRLNAHLLLGYTRIHSFKVRYFQEDIKKTHERLTLSFRPSSESIDLPKTSKKSEAARLEAITLPTKVLQYDLSLEIDDELPDWLDDDTNIASQLDTGSSVQGSLPSARSARSSRINININLPDRGSERSSTSGIDDDLMSDVISIQAVSEGAANPLDVPMDDFNANEYGYQGSVDDSSSGRSLSKGGASSGSAGQGSFVAGEAGPWAYAADAPGEHDFDIPPQDMDYGVEAEPRDEMAQSVKQKRKRKGPKRDAQTQLLKEECRMWLEDTEWIETHLCRNPAVYRRPLPENLVAIISGPLTAHMGRTLVKKFRTYGLQENAPEKPVASTRAKKPRVDVELGGNGEGPEFVDYNMDIDVGHIDFDLGGIGGDSSSGGDGVSVSYGSEDPEAIRAASEDGSAFKQPAPRAKSRASSDAFDAPSAFELDSLDSLEGRSSIASSGKGRLTSFGGLDDGGWNLTGDGAADSGAFSNASLREEPETNPSQANVTQQRLNDYAVSIARKIAANLPEADSTLSFQRIVRPDKTTRRDAARIFYSLLVLKNENVLDFEQVKWYGDMIIKPTENTAMYA